MKHAVLPLLLIRIMDQAGETTATTDWYGDDDEESALPFAQIGEEMKLDLVDE